MVTIRCTCLGSTEDHRIHQETILLAPLTFGGWPDSWFTRLLQLLDHLALVTMRSLFGQGDIFDRRSVLLEK